MSETSHFAGLSSGATKRMLDEGSESETGAVKRQKLFKYHATAGLKLTIHGNVYQLKLLTLFLRRGLDLGYSFTLTTEIVAAEKFDDIVFGYTDKNGKDVCRFLQAKHKQDDTKKITLRDLLTEKDDEFSIKKYFISYRKIKQNLEFKGYYLQDFTICTNINLDENFVNNLEEITGTDDILHFEYHDEFRRYKINLDQFPKKDQLESILRRTSEHLRLANMLAVHVLENKPLKLSDLFKAYHGVLGKKVIDVEVGKFRNEFIDGESDQSSVLERFRKSFYEEYRRVSKTQIDENDFWVKMKDTNLKISSTFGRKFELDPNPQLTADKEALAEEIVKAIKMANQNIVQILRERGKKSGIIKDNIDKLAGYVFVKKEDESKEFYFNSKFFDVNEKLPCHLEEFRTKFVEKLRGEGIEFSKMNECRFHIANFMACEEGQLHMKPSLPDDYIDDTDIQGFFESFILSVNQPNEEKLGDIIQDEIGKDFNLIDSDLMASKLLEDMLNWMKEKKGRFLSNDEGNKLFKEIHKKVSKLVLIGPTLVYRAKMEQFQISFRDDLNVLQDFLNSGHEQIFNLISSCNDTILSSIKVLQTLKNMDTYQTDDSYIYMRLNSILCIWKHVMEAFCSGTSNLLAIECKAEKNEAKSNKLYKGLSALLKIEKNKKVILITLKNDTFAEKFKRDFSAKNHYKEIDDEQVNLTDLIVKSQEKILTESKVIFLGKKVSLNAVIDAESTHLLSGEVLSMLIKNDKLEIGEPPNDPKHIEVEDYFIDRTLTRYIMIKSDFMEEKKMLVLDDRNPNELCDYTKREIDGSYTDIILISDSCDEFIKLCEKYRKQHSIHWLKKEKGKNGFMYRWKQSCGNLTKLCRFIDRSAQSVTKYKPNKITDASDKVVLVAAEPGMGKSALLSHLSLETQSIPSPLWIVRTDLIDHSNKFSDWLNTNADTVEISLLDAVKFLYEIIFGEDAYLSKDGAVDGKIKDVISSCLTQNEENFEIAARGNAIKNMTGSLLLQIKLFTHFFNKGKVVLLFDGFDEISPYYNDLVVKLLKVLKDTKVKSLWLTTRPYNILRVPENQFSAFAYTLQPFLREDQNNFLKKYWIKNRKLRNFDEGKVNVFIDELMNQFSKTTNDPDRKFLSIPLQILMLADTLSVEFEKSPEHFWENKDALVNKLDLVTLYENFLENKLDIELEKIISYEGDRKKPGMLSITEKERLDFRKSHEILAVCSIFEVDQCNKVLTTGELELIKELKVLISEAKRKTGVIINIVDDKPEFIHRTFAEYFVAQSIWKKFISIIELKEFKEKIVCDIVIEMLIRDGGIQVSKFLALIAKKYFYSSIDPSKWENKIEILLINLTNQIEKYGATEKDNFQSIKLLLGIIEFFLQKQEEEFLSKILENHSKIIQNQSPELLCVCAEMGYTILARTLTNLNTELLKQHLSQTVWSNSPLWLAAENGHLDIIKFLVERFSYAAEWQDVYGESLIQLIFSKDEFNILKSCLELNIIDGRPFKERHGDAEKLPICEALSKRAPVEVIKLLIEKTDADLVNVFIHDEYELLERGRKLSKLIEYKLPGRDIMLSKLLEISEKRVEINKIIKLALKKGIDFSFCLNDVLCSLDLNNICYPVRVQYLCHITNNKFKDRCFSCEGYNHLWNLFPIIKHLLKAGVGYSYINGRRDPPSDSTYCIVKRMYDMHKLLNQIYNLHKQNDKENDDPRQMLFRLLFNYIRSLGFETLEITINPKELLILPHYQEECDHEHKFRIIHLIARVIQMSNYFNYSESNLIPKTMCISVPRERIMFSIFGYGQPSHGLPFPASKHFLTKLFFRWYIDGNSKLDFVKRAVDEVKTKRDVDEAYPSCHAGFLQDKLQRRKDILKYNLDEFDKELERCKESLNKENLCNLLWFDVLHLHHDQCYKKTDALDEISENIIKLEEAFNKLLETKNKSSSGCNMILDENQILDILGLKNIDCECEDLQKLVSEISETLTGIRDLTDICCAFNQVCQQNVIPVLEHWLTLSNPSKRIFNLFKELHEGYENLICAVKEDDIDKVTSTLQNVDQDFVKAIIHGQDKNYGSPLHYAAFKGQAGIINIFLDLGANPNLRLCNNFEKITHFSQAVEKINKGLSLSDDFVNWTPLHLAVLNDHLEVVQILIEWGADVNPAENGYSPLNISPLSYCSNVKIAQLLLNNGAHNNVSNKKGITPLNLAMSGSDVEKLLRSMAELFLIVNWGGTDAANSVFEVLNIDSQEAVLIAKNIDGKIRLFRAENIEWDDIFELLSEKLPRSVDLVKVLHEGYENLIGAVEEGDIDKVRSVLQNVNQHIVKAIINRQDKDYGSPLHYAAFKGQTDIMKIFLDHGANPNLRLCKNFEKIIHFSQAVEKINKGPSLSDDFVNWTPLYFAVLNDHLEVVQILIERGADVDPDEDCYSPLHISALLCGDVKIARLLLNNGASYNVSNEKGITPLNLAKSGSDVEKLLRSMDELFQIVEWGGTDAANSVFEVLNVDSQEFVLIAEDTDGWILLHKAANIEYDDICELLSEKLLRPVDLVKVLHEGYENLICAVEEGDINKVRSVLQSVNQRIVKAIVNRQDEDYGSPLHYAAFKGQVKIMKIFLDHGAYPNLRLCNNFEKITYFLQAVEKINKGLSLSDDFVNWTPLYFAVLNDHLEVVQILIERGADVDPVVDGYSPLHISALSCGDVKIARLLLNNGATYNVSNRKGITPLNLAKSGSDVEKLLRSMDELFQIVEWGGTDAANSVFEVLNVDSQEFVLIAKNTDGRISLDKAANIEYDDIFELLSEKLLRPDDLVKVLHEGYENLIGAVEESDIDKVSSVLRNVKQHIVKAIVNRQDEDYGSPLHYAALIGRADMINILLDHGANPNLRLCNHFGKITHFSQAVEKMKKDPFQSNNFVNWPPLYFAVLNDRLEVVQNLIERGADVNPDVDGYSPLHISALSCGSLKIAQLLLKNGAHYDVPNEDGQTPVDLATSGSDVGKLLHSIEELFQIVEKDEANAVNSVFEGLNFDSWEAVLNAKNSDDETLLELTENNEQEEIFKLLSEKLLSSVDLIELHEGYGNLICAVKENNIDKVRSALQNVNQHFVKAIINYQDEDYGSPLHYAAFKGQADTIKIFLGLGANPNLRLCNNFEKTAHFSQALEKINKGLSSSDDFLNWTPLHFAVLNDHLQVVQILIEGGADVNPDDGYSPLHISALTCGSLKISRLLVKNGAWYNIQNEKGETPIDLATSGSDVEKLLRSMDELFRIVKWGGIDATNSVFEVLNVDSQEVVLIAKNINGRIGLVTAVNNEWEDIFQLLSEKLLRPVNLVKVLHEGYENLICAVEEGDIDKVRSALQNVNQHIVKAIVNRQDEDYGSPLHYAALSGRADLINILLDHGAYPNLRLCNNFKYITHFPQAVKKLGNSDSYHPNSFVNWTPLYFAVLNDHLEIVQILVERGADVNNILYPGWRGCSPLHISAMSCGSLKIARLLVNNRACYNMPNEEGKTPIDLATSGSDVEKLLRSIEELIRICEWGGTDAANSVFEVLNVSVKVVLNARNIDGEMGLWAAENIEYDDICELLSEKLLKPVDLVKVLHEGYEYLIGAVEEGDIDKVRSVLQNVNQHIVKAIINRQDEDYGSPLHYAAFSGRADIINILLDHGANPNLRLCNNFKHITHFSQAVEKLGSSNSYPPNYFLNWTPLYFAVLNDYLEVVQILTERGADVFPILYPGWRGCSPLHISALSCGSLNIARLLVNNGRYYKIPNEEGKTPLDLAMPGSDVEMLLCSMDKLFQIAYWGGTDAANSVFEVLNVDSQEVVLTAKNIDGDIMLLKAKNIEFDDIFELLSEKLQRPVDLVKVLHEGYENLIDAVEEGDIDKVRSVLQNVNQHILKAIVNRQDEDYGSPLHYAAFKGQADIIKIFLDLGANPNLRLCNYFGKMTHFSPAVKKISKGPSSCDDFVNWTPLYFAVLNDHLEVVQILIERGADVNPAVDGYSLLHISALSYGGGKIARLLLKNGTHHNVSNKKGITPLNLATSGSDVEKLLRSIDELMQIVEWGGTDSANSVFELLNFDSQEAVLIADSTEGRISLRKAANIEYDDICELLSEKLLRPVDLVKVLHEGYENLIGFVEDGDIDKVRSVLQNVNQHIVKAIVNRQDEDYGSPLHYTAFKGQSDMIKIFLDLGANPNLRLCNNFKHVTHFSQALKKMGNSDSYLPNHFVDWTPLCFAVLNDHLEVVQNLMERGADVNHLFNSGQRGYSALHVSALSCGSLKIAQLLLKNGARYNVPNKNGKTPLNLATFGSDVGNLLCFIDVLFRIVEEGETNAVNSVFEVLDFDLWEAVLSAKNADDETLLKLTESNGQEDIFELLSERLRLVESHGL